MLQLGGGNFNPQADLYLLDQKPHGIVGNPLVTFPKYVRPKNAA